MQGSSMYQQFQPQNNNMLMMLQQIKQNPVAMLSQRFNIPPTLNTQNPNDILQYLLNSGQVTQMQINQAMQMGNQFR